MDVLVAAAVAFATGVIFGAVIVSIIANRRRKKMLRVIVASIGPVLERRGAILGVTTSSSPEVNVGLDGELRVSDGLEQLIQLAEAIDAQEHAQLGYVDTMRVSKEEVDAHVLARNRASKH